MDRIRFNVRKPDVFPVVLLRDDGTETPIPPRYRVPGEAELTIRLESTRGGGNARWYIGVRARRALNEAPYQPMLRAVVAGFLWEPANTRDCPSEIASDLVMPGVMFYESSARPRDVVQAGSGVLNWEATVVRRLPDRGRAWIRAVIGAVGGEMLRTVDRVMQGSLTIQVLEGPADGFLRRVTLPTGSGSRWIYNHCVIGHAGVAARVDITNTMRVLVMPGRRAGVVILSPDHPGDPISVPGGGDASSSIRMLLLHHPVPRTGQRDDGAD